MHLSSAQFERIVAIVGARWGLDLTARQRSMVDARVERLLSGRTSADVDQYIAFIEDGAREVDQLDLFDALSNKVTGFFRDRGDFEYLEREFYTPLARGNTTTPGRRIRIWSAGCSIGAEPYSLAMQMCECLPELHKWDVEILATDLSPTALKQANTAAYPAEMLASIDAAQVERCFLRETRGWLHVRPDVRRLVRVAPMNLAAVITFDESFDVIVCRDVLRHMNERARASLSRHLVKHLRIGGKLLLGRGEKPTGDEANVRQVQPSVFIKDTALPAHIRTPAA